MDIISRRNFCALFLLLTALTHAIAQKSINANFQSLKLPYVSTQLDSLVEKSKENQLIYLKLNSNILPAQCEQQGITLQQYLHDSIYIGYINKNVNTQIIAEWKSIDADEKINGQLKRAIDIDSNVIQNILVAFVSTVVTEEIDLILAKNYIAVAKGQPWFSEKIYQVSMPGKYIKTLAQSQQIKYINPAFEDKILNNQAIGMTNTQIAHQPFSLGGYNLSGAGVTVGVGDDANPQTHVDVENHISFFNPQLRSPHGFHTTLTVGGSGIRDERYKGFAPNAHLLSQFFSGVISNARTLVEDYGMSITNNSYGAILGDCDYAGTYDIYSQILDQQMTDHPQLLHVFASANDGDKNCGGYTEGLHTTAGAFQSAKNILVVGNARKYYSDILYYNSSRGPVKDGRIKPEIMAVGTNLWSGRPNHEYEWSVGTSMAAPNVAGASALLYERYKQLHSNVNPDAVLIKLLLMNGATDILNPGPDFKSGFGLMNIRHSLLAIDSSSYFSNSINTGQTQNFTFSIPENIATAKVMLCWNDPAAMPESAKTLINDLDVKVNDPMGETHFPLILNPEPEHANELAVQGFDRINNVEQVILKNPSAGTYTISVSGFDVPISNQKYYVAYDFIPIGVQIQSPFGGEAFAAGDSIVIYWEASDAASTYKVQVTTDNGASWHIVEDNIPANINNAVWYIPSDLASTQCKIKVSRGAQTSISESFTVIGRPVLTIAPEAEQCPGAVKIYWTHVPNADSYKVFIHEGNAMVAKATVPSTDSTFTFFGLNRSEEQWVSVAPIIDGKTGMRAIAESRLPMTGSCSGIENGDMSIVAVLYPTGGRAYTKLELGNQEKLKVKVQNLSGTLVSQFKIAYQLNNDAWKSQNFIKNIQPASTATIILNTIPIDMSNYENYDLKIVVTNLQTTDEVAANDTLFYQIKNVANEPLNLNTAFVDDFETTDSLNQMQAEFAIDGAPHWDFEMSKSKGQIRNFVSSDILISGTKSISLDNNFNQKDNALLSSFNTLLGTFNLSNYQFDSTELRLGLDYRLAGVPKFNNIGNRIWIRANDTAAWHLAYIFDTTNIGDVHHTGSISLNDFLAGDTSHFSTSVQVKIEQYDTSLICATDYGNGLTIDNFSIYKVANDVQMLSIDSLPKQSCGLGSRIPLTIQVRNGVMNPIENIKAFYQLDSGAVVSETIPFINSKDTFKFTFAQEMDVSEPGWHTLRVWVHHDGDTYTQNDSLLHYKFYNQTVVNTYPYFQNFEESNGGYYSNNNTWQYGAPQSPKINKAASGQYAWKTNLEGFYSPNTLDYLYSPCFDISLLKKPMISFSMAYNIEPKSETSIYDAGYLEYSNDGIQWQKLGQYQTGENWYTDSNNVWEGKNTDWHIASHKLPKSGALIMFRFVLKSDEGAEVDGLAVDDIQVYDLNHSIYDQKAEVNLFPNPARDGYLKLNWVKGDDKPLTWILYDISGRKLASSEITENPFMGQKTIALNDLKISTGILLMKVFASNQQWVFKVVYQK